MCPALEKAAQGAANALGASIEIRKSANTYLNMVNNITLAETLKNNMLSLGMEIEGLSRRGVATDMGNVSQVAPSIHPFIAIGPKGIAWHSRESANAASSPQAYTATIKTAKAFGMTAIDIFSNPGLVRRIRGEFSKSKRNLSFATL